MSAAREQATSLELRFSTCQWDVIPQVRRLVAAYQRELLPEHDLVGRVALTVHELLENAVKYSKPGDTFLRVELSFEADTRTVSVTVCNRATPEAIAQLEAHVAALLRFEDPMVGYQQMLRRAAKKDGGSGLGLARIMAEGEMTLRVRVEEPETVYVTARARSAERRDA
ncbi:MAG: ATP-binding protein [Deltaproteobacteria bacterium]|nr:ATP-binding protein [Deltaproteobacteria bacterium]